MSVEFKLKILRPKELDIWTNLRGVDVEVNGVPYVFDSSDEHGLRLTQPFDGRPAYISWHDLESITIL